MEEDIYTVIVGMLEGFFKNLLRSHLGQKCMHTSVGAPVAVGNITQDLITHHLLLLSIMHLWSDQRNGVYCEMWSESK